MTTNEKIKFLKGFKKAINQAYALISIDDDCFIEKQEFKDLERIILNKDKVIDLTKQYIERKNKNGI